MTDESMPDLGQSPAGKEATEFAWQHPEVGPIIEGETLDQPQLEALTGLMVRRVIEISRRPGELHEHERAFVNQVLNMGSRTIVYLMDQRGFNLDGSVEAEQALNRIKAGMRAFQGGALPSEFQTHGLSRGQLISIINSLSDSAVAIERDDQVNRAPVEDLTKNVVSLLPRLARLEDTGLTYGLPVDRYLKGNLDNMIAHYQLTEARS